MTHAGDVLSRGVHKFEEFGEVGAKKALDELEASDGGTAGRAPDLMSGNSLELARMLVDHYSLVVAERLGAATPPEPLDDDGDSAVSDPEKRMFQ